MEMLDATLFIMEILTAKPSKVESTIFSDVATSTSHCQSVYHLGCCRTPYQGDFFATALIDGKMKLASKEMSNTIPCFRPVLHHKA